MCVYIGCEHFVGGLNYLFCGSYYNFDTWRGSVVEGKREIINDQSKNVNSNSTRSVKEKFSRYKFKEKYQILYGSCPPVVPYMLHLRVLSYT